LDLEDVMTCSVVNKQFSKVIKSETVWCQLFKQHFWNVKCTKNFYDNFKECYDLNEFLIDYYDYNVNFDVNEVIEYTILRFDESNISNLPYGFRQLTLLEELLLDCNQIITLQPGICELSSLKILYIDHNKLSALPEEISKLSLLQELYVDHNNLQMIPNSINQLTNLQILSIHHNNLQKLPTMDKLVNLCELHLDEEQMSLIIPEINIKNNILEIW
jgi:hypothetical protein